MFYFQISNFFLFGVLSVYFYGNVSFFFFLSLMSWRGTLRSAFVLSRWVNVNVAFYVTINTCRFVDFKLDKRTVC